MWCKVPAILVNIMLSILTVVGSVAMVITLPLYSSSVICAGSDPYSVLFFSSFWFQLVSEHILFGGNFSSPPLFCWNYFVHKITILVQVFFVVQVTYKFGVNRDSQLFPNAKWWIVIVIGFLGGFNGLLVVYASPPYRTPAYLQVEFNLL